jgi:hypothetical protein
MGAGSIGGSPFLMGLIASRAASRASSIDVTPTVPTVNQICLP